MTLKQANCIAVEHYCGKTYQCIGGVGHGGMHKFRFPIDQICCCQGDPCACKPHAFSMEDSDQLENENISANKSKTISLLNKHINKLDNTIEQAHDAEAREELAIELLRSATERAERAEAVIDWPLKGLAEYADKDD